MTRHFTRKSLPGVSFAFISAVGLLASAVSAKATLLAYEGFDYTTDVRMHTGLNGGTGWTGAWGNLTGALTNNAPVQPGSLGYTDGFGNILVTSGNSVFLTGYGLANGGTTGSPSPNRVFTGGPVGQSGSESWTWISFMSQVIGPPTVVYSDAGGTVNYGRAQGMNLMNGTAERGLVGRSSQNAENTTAPWPNDTWALNVRGSGNFTTNTSISSVSLTTLSLLLVGIHHDGNQNNSNDVAYLWINPSDLANPTNTAPDAFISQVQMGGTQDMNIDRIRLFAGGSNNIVGYGNIIFDEIRIGNDTPQDVLPYTSVPEPTVVCLLGLAGLGLVFRFRRNK